MDALQGLDGDIESLAQDKKVINREPARSQMEFVDFRKEVRLNEQIKKH